MSEHYCTHPTCYESEETCTMYKEETKHGDPITLCGKHVSEPKARDGKVTVIMSSTNTEAETANAEILQAIANE